MRKLIIAIAAAGAVSLSGVSAPAVPVGPAVAEAKSCSAGWRHAALPWGHKCLRRGQFCKKVQDRAYHRYGFHCHGGRLR